MSNVRNLFPGVRQLPTGTEPPDNDDMQARVAKLEALAEKTGERLGAIEKELVRVEGSIRAEIHREISSQTWKLISFVCGFGGALVAATFFIAKHVG